MRSDEPRTCQAVLAAASGASTRDLVARGHDSMRALIYQHANREADRRIAELRGTLKPGDEPEATDETQERRLSQAENVS